MSGLALVGDIEFAIFNPALLGKFLDPVIDALVEAFVDLAAYAEDDGGPELSRLGGACRKYRGDGDKLTFRDPASKSGFPCSG